MTEEAAGERRTRRRGATGASTPPAAAEPRRNPDGRLQRGAQRKAGGRGSAERSLRDLVAGAPSQLGVDGALRARDVNRPTEDDLAEAERDVTIVRRNWRPDPQP